jgi:intermediate cleaving peptidase 55
MTSDPPHLLLAAALAGEKAQPLEREVQRLRLVKSKVELGIMKRAADISAAGHRRVMRAAQEGMPEGRLVAEFEYECGLGGSERPAYVPVVASGSVHTPVLDRYRDQREGPSAGRVMNKGQG